VVAAAQGDTVAEPRDVVGLGALHPGEGTDLRAAGVLRFDGGTLAQVACGVDLVQQDHVRVFGTTGALLVDQPCWLAGRREAGSVIRLVRRDGGTEPIEVPPARNIFALEADGFAELVEGGPDAWRATWPVTMANQRTLDRWRAAAGVHYGDLEG
jgi:predicted dehydrogenase